MKNKINAIETSASLMYKFSIKKASAANEIINKETICDLFI